MPLLKPLSTILRQQNLLSRSLSFLFLFTVLNFVKIKYHLSPPLLEIYSMKKVSFAHSAFSLLVLLAQCNFASASSAAFTPTTVTDIYTTLNNTFPPDSDLRRQLHATAGFENDEKVIAYFSAISIGNAYEEVKNSEEFARRSSNEKKLMIWDVVRKKMTNSAGPALQKNSTKIKGFHINKMVNDITRFKFTKEWDAQGWETSISAPQASSDNTDSNVHDTANVDDNATRKSPEASSSNSSMPRQLNLSDEIKTQTNSDSIENSKTRNSNLGKPSKQDTSKTTSPVDDTKKSFKFSEYRKTIIGAIACVGISVWLYSKYNHMKTQNSMSVGTVA
jgi:hypothetical protein